MGFISRIFGGDKQDKALREAIERVTQILEDEKLQLEMIHPAMKAMIESRPAYDIDPNGTGPFGFIETNPIPVNGPIGQLAYLSKLETKSGERILFHRIGAIDLIDIFEAVTFSGSEWFILFLDLYHPRRSRLTPEGFKFSEEIGQFSGFNKFCESFPYDFIEMKSLERESGLSMAYIAISRVSESIDKGAFQRPLAHSAKLDIVRSKITSGTI